MTMQNETPMSSLAIKKSIIKEIIKIKEHPNSYGITYYFTLLLENGEKGQIGKKRKDAFRVGDEFTYQAQKTDKGLNFIPVQVSNKFQNQNPTNSANSIPVKSNNYSNNASFALSYAKDLHIARIEAGDKDAGNPKAIIDTAEEFHKWLISKQN